MVESGYQKPTFDFFSDNNQGRKNKKMSKRQEKKIAKTGESGKLTPGSGNKRIKGDVWKSGRMYEAKVTDAKSIKVEREWLEKLEKEAYAANKEPVFVFGFEGSHLLRQSNWGAVPLERLEELFEIERRYKDGGTS